jgi:hypothetical protein
MKGRRGAVFKNVDVWNMKGPSEQGVSLFEE